MTITKDWVKMRYCELCFKEPENDEKFTYIKISDKDYRPRATLVVCDKCLNALRKML